MYFHMNEIKNNLSLLIFLWLFFLSVQLSSANATNLVDLTRKLRSEANNFTNKRLFFSYLKELFKTGVRILSPVSQQNDMEALNFTKVSYSINGLWIPVSSPIWPSYYSSQ